MSDLRYGRVYMDHEPVRGAHAGYRGPMSIDACGVHLSLDCEHLSVDNESAEEDWPMGTWMAISREEVLPWHRVDLLEWGSAEEFGAT